MKFPLKSRSFFCFLCLVGLCCSCRNPKQKSLEEIVEKWQGKEIVFPADAVFTLYGRDTVEAPGNRTEYKILMYVDSVGCMSCRLKLERWADWLAYLDTAAVHTVSYWFYFYPKDANELSDLLKYKSFRYPVCIDTEDRLNRLNGLSSNPQFQAFLLDKDNRVQVIGNPVNNPAVRTLYEKHLLSEPAADDERPSTRVEAMQPVIDVGELRQSDVASATFIIKNTGKKPLVVTAVDTDCGCLSVTYEKKPVAPGQRVSVKALFEPKETGVFEKTVRVYGNMEQSPLLLKVKGRVTE